MDGQSFSQPAAYYEVDILRQLSQKALKMSTWLRILGYASIICGVLSIFLVIGLLFAWLFIWLGLTLIQAANRAKAAEHQQNAALLLQMMDRLHLYFAISVTTLIIALVFGGMFIFYLLNWLAGQSGNFSDLLYLYL